MSFWPLAKTLTDQLRASRTSELVVELGSGEAEFAARLGEISIAPILLDRDMAALTRARSTLPLLPALCAVAQSLPFRDTSVGVVLCANLLRHCRGEWERVAAEIQRVMTGDAILVILEDDPLDPDESARVYRDTLDLLASVDSTRGAAVDALEVERLCVGRFGEPILSGSEHNVLRIEDPQLPLRWLSAQALDARERDALRDLAERVELHGMNYGRYYYRVFGKRAVCAA